MDENEPQGGLAQAVAPPPVASHLAAAPAAKPEPSEYEKALASYQQQKQQLIEGTKIGADIAKHRAQMAVQMAQRASQKPKKE